MLPKRFKMDNSEGNDWQRDKSNIKERMFHLLNMNLWTDCQFLVGKEPEQKVFDAHKIILAACSPVFECQFFGNFPESRSPIPIPDISTHIFKTMLDFFYTDELEIKCFEECYELLYVAHKYMVPNLMSMCTKYLVSYGHAGNACKIYELGKLFEEQSLLESSLQTIQFEADAVLQNPSFEDIELDTLLMILDLKNINVSSERIIFDAVCRWGVKECQRKGISEDDSIRKAILPALGKIHFLLMSPIEFAEGPALKPILTKDEKLSIFINLSDPNTNVEIPHGFSNKSHPRKHCNNQTQNLSKGVRKLYCQCTSDSIMSEEVRSEVDYCLSFSTDKEIDILGFQISSQIKVFQNSYTELMHAHLLDSDNCRLTYTHFTSKVNTGSPIEILFNRPIRNHANKTYKISVVLNKSGTYEFGTIKSHNNSHGVNFKFQSNTEYNSLIRTIIFNNGNKSMESIPIMPMFGRPSYR